MVSVGFVIIRVSDKSLIMKKTSMLLRCICLMLIALILMVSQAEARRPDRIRVRFETTMGKFTIELFNETPQHRDNFVRLVREGFYDGILFHRVIRNFMVQAGDPDSRTAGPNQLLGEGDTGYTIPAEIRTPDIFHRRGMVAAAREGDAVNPQRRSSGAQFYVVWGKRFDETELRAVREKADRYLKTPLELTSDMVRAYRIDGGTPHLDGQYTVFGRIVKGLKVIGRIERVKTDENDRPLENVRIIRAYVLE